MRDHLTYLASPYSDPDPAVMEQRFRDVARIAAVRMAIGELLYSPITHTHPIAVAGELPKDWGFWERYDRRMLACCDSLTVVMLDGWQDSRGVQAEIKIALELGLPVRYINKYGAECIGEWVASNSL